MRPEEEREPLYLPQRLGQVALALGATLLLVGALYAYYRWKLGGGH